jgi:diguanylate cyclase (GGDEF)-like protein
MLRQACNAAALTHVVFLLLFAKLGMPLLVWANIASIALFVGGRTLLQQRRNTIAMSLIAGEVVLHAAVASRLLGWDSGFHYYLLTLIGPLAVVMHGTMFSKVVRLLAFGAGYAALDTWTRQVPPVYRVEPFLLDSIRYFNVGGMLAITAFISLTYYRLVASAESALRTLASTDPLTGLHNRRQLLEIVRATRGAIPPAPGLFLLLCDIDHFKHVNDHHGHEVGDLVLQRIASAVTAAVRATDSVARWGGEEFVVLLPGADLRTAMQTGERIRCAVAALSVQQAELPSAIAPAAGVRPAIPVTITIGVARVDPADTIGAALARADAALFRGKAAGRNRVVDGEAAPPTFA